MARTEYQSNVTIDPTLVSLTRLLSHLQRNLLSPDAEFQLPKSSYERTKVSANLEYARSLLLRLEHDSSGIKIQSRKQNVQADLQTKREIVKQLNQRLYDLNQLDSSENDSESSSDEEDEDLAPVYAPAVRDASSGIDIEQPASTGPGLFHQAATDLTSTLRARRTQQDDRPQDSSTATGSLFEGRHRPSSPQDASTARRETRLTDDRTQQEALTNSLLNMAQALKDSSLKFSSSLEAEKDILERAGSGLDKNTTGMQSAGQRMSSLRKMTEGWGFIWRLGTYPAIAVGWLFALLIVFAFPKLRF